VNPFVEQWCLDPEVVYLNHGAFGACPRRVLDYQRALRDEIQRQPTAFFERRYYDNLNAAVAG